MSERGRPPKPSPAGKKGNLAMYSSEGVMVKAVEVLEYRNNLLSYKEIGMNKVIHTNLDFVFEET